MIVTTTPCPHCGDEPKHPDEIVGHFDHYDNSDDWLTTCDACEKLVLIKRTYFFQTIKRDASQ